LPSSSTSETAAGGLTRRLGGHVRLVHPFPSLLDGLVSAAVAALAGAPPIDAIRLGVAMTALQFGIGATNDVVDAPRDAGHKLGKPIPAGLVAPATARAIAIGGFAAGLLLSVPSGPWVVALAVVVIAIGLLYDLGLKGTAWSWLPFAVGIPILPVFGWLGATGSLPAPFAVLVPVAVAAGAALAISNGLVDVERDRAAGASSIALAIGPGRAWILHLALLVGVGVAAVASVAAWGRSTGELLLVAVPAIVPVLGAAAARGRGALRRERAWEVEAVGTALLAVGWLWVVGR
jgi:4-hydroxybenzoate polyprenyltransferase